MYSHDDQLIIAQCTPTGSGAIALLRLSGLGAVITADKIADLPGNKRLIDQPTHTIHYGYVVDDKKNRIDQVLFLLMHAPHTFTGQDTVEISCHNNPFIIQRIIEVAIEHGARLATAGEFTKRAVLNNKIDLVQAEAINDLIHANTQLALKQSLGQLHGTLSSWIKNFETNLLKALALSEASFEFLDEEYLTFGIDIQKIIDQLLQTIETIKSTYSQQQHIRNGIRIALIGSVNAGKSSLFNALLQQERAIVTNIAGTTRDSIEAGLYKNGNYWTLIDTAGLRNTDDIIEQAGIVRSRAEAQKADIILLVYDIARAYHESEYALYQEFIAQYPDKVIVLHNKTDLGTTNKPLPCSTTIHCSAIDKSGVDQIEHAIETKIKNLFSSIESPFLLNQRQFNLILGLETELTIIKQLLSGTIHYEIVSLHLQEALAHLSELTGKSISEKGLDAVFREFCVGK